MKLFHWSWTKFLVGLSINKMPNMEFRNVWCVCVHIGFITIIICPNWDPYNVLNKNKPPFLSEGCNKETNI